MPPRGDKSTYKPPGGRGNQQTKAQQGAKPNPFGGGGAIASAQPTVFGGSRAQAVGNNTTKPTRGQGFVRGARGASRGATGLTRGTYVGRGRGDAVSQPSGGRGVWRGTDTRGRGRGRGDNNASSQRGGARGGFQGTVSSIAEKRDESHLPAEQRLQLVNETSNTRFESCLHFAIAQGAPNS